MFSRILIKLVDEAIVPAILLIVTRIVSVVFITNKFQIESTFGPSGFIFADAQDYILVNSYSTLSMLVVLTVGLLYVLLKSYITHDTHITPMVSAKLFSMRVTSFIQTSFDIYSQGAIWLSYSYLITLVSAILSFYGFLYSWVFVVGAVLSLISTYFFVLDVEEEVFSRVVDDTSDLEEELVLELKGLDGF